MSTVWYAIPSKRPPEECDPVLKLWSERGYRIALWRDWADATRWPLSFYAAFARTAPKYPGYAIAVNELCKQILEQDAEAEWIVTGGDDVEPDPNHSAEEIAAQCSDYFRDDSIRTIGLQHETFGVMQPTGDPWSDTKGRIIERIAGSPWIGREFCRRMNGGAGPLWQEYTHCFEDEELQCVAQKLGVFWQRPDLTHKHNHWMRKPNAKVPPHLAEATSPQHWAKFKALFEIRKRAGFPGHEPIP